MYSDEIETILSKDVYASNFFEGVYAIDLLPSILKPSKIYIVNLQAHDRDNQFGHWCQVSTLSSPLSTFYMDPFGQPPPSSIWTSLLSAAPVNYYSNLQLQNFLTAACGQFVTLTSLLQARGYDPLEILRHFMDIEGYLMRDAYVTDVISHLTHLRDAPLMVEEIFKQHE